MGVGGGWGGVSVGWGGVGWGKGRGGRVLVARHAAGRPLVFAVRLLFVSTGLAETLSGDITLPANYPLLKKGGNRVSPR